MSYLLVPLGVSTGDATVWIGAVNEPVDPPPPLILEYDLQHQPLDPAGWSRWVSEDRGYTLLFQRLTFTGLTPRSRYPLRLRSGNEIKAEGEVTTLPASLPTLTEKPFTLLLGSCFSELQDQGGSVGATYFRLPAGVRPDVKILCGDQVYLDAPWHHYLRPWKYSREELESRFFDIYLRAWRQSGMGSGFQQLLKSGANYFTSDDHEFWNNAPNKAVYVRNTWSDSGRDEWLQLARRFYETFQPTGSTASFAVGPLSFFIADTRVDRSKDQTDFMPSPAFGQLEKWIQSLPGPGVLVIGQPLFAEKAGWKGNFTDWHLPDYRQYESLARAISASRQPIVILTGDVHFGRVARSTLPSGVPLIEVISSPMSLVDKKAGGKWDPPPGVFPATEAPGVVKRPIQDTGYQITENHFMTLEFSAVGARVQMAAKSWPIVQGGAAPIPKEVIQPILL
ncbi:MAG: hypothetical protein WAO55_06875 [Candidatus Manganitrophaceae bacterium]